MAHYIVQFTKAGTPQHREMPEQARQLLRTGLWGIPAKAQLRMRVMPGDGVLIAVGAPDRVFIGDAVVASAYHRFNEDEAARFPKTLAFDHGIALARARVWPRSVPVMAIWPQTVAARTNPKALWFGTLTPLRSTDAALVLAAAAVEDQPGSDEPEAVRSDVGVSGRRAAAAPAHAPPLPRTSSDAATEPRLDPHAAIDHAARALQAAERSPPWLPARIAHADWGTATAKLVVATAELDARVYHAHAPQTVAEDGELVERMRLSGRRGATTLLGFDFPIGVPRAYAHSASIENFAGWFRELDLDSPFFEPASTLAEVSTFRPFFPSLPPRTKTPGLKANFHQALGVPGAELLRRCDRAHCDRRAASEMFWTIGPAAVGKATLAGWKHALRRALAEPDRRYPIWPFDGTTAELLQESDAVIVETYPTEAYRQLNLRMGSPGTAKTRQEDRRGDARRILDWCADNAVIPDDRLLAQLIDGFGPTAAGEDLFDAVVGLFGMVDTVRRRAEPELPDDRAVTQLEGWMFGQHAHCP